MFSRVELFRPLHHQDTSVAPFLEETHHIYQPEVIVLDTPRAVDLCTAARVSNLVRQKPDAVLILPTGSTPEGMYDLLVQLHQWSDISLHDVTVINLDEYHGLPQTHEGTYYSYMRRNLFDPARLPLRNWYIPNSEAVDAVEETNRIEAIFQQLGRKDLAVLGIGPGTTCHIGFNERGSTADSRTRCVELDEQTITANSRLFPNPDEIPRKAITLGIGNILEAERIMLLAKGEHKAQGVKLALEGHISPQAPASFLRLHPNTTFVLDRAAASALGV